MVTGSRADVIMCLGHIPKRDAIKGPEVGSGSHNRRLTEIGLLLPDESIFRSVRASPLAGGTTDMQNDLAYSAPPPPGQQGDLGYNLGRNIDLGRLNYGLGAWLQVISGSQPHPLRGEGPEISSRDILSEAGS
jgi:hypothetical protein